MGNLGRQGYMRSTEGMWPYSFSQCNLGETNATAVPGSQVPPQLISACPDNPANTFNRTKYGFKTGVGRGAPEFDVFEVVYTGDTMFASQTLQMAPLLPPGQTWTDMNFYAQNGLAPGINFPGATGGNPPTNTRVNPWVDPFGGRSGNEYQDSISAVSDLGGAYSSGYHRFGVDWKPGQWLRWYIDGRMVYEVNKNALVQRSDGSKFVDCVLCVCVRVCFIEKKRHVLQQH